MKLKQSKTQESLETKVKPKLVPKKLTKEDKKELQTIEKTPAFIRTYVVALGVLEFRQNVLVKVRANNDYCAILEAMRKYTKTQASEYEDKAAWINQSWEAEEKLLCSRCRTFPELHSYLRHIGFLISKPLIIEED